MFWMGSQNNPQYVKNILYVFDIGSEIYNEQFCAETILYTFDIGWLMFVHVLHLFTDYMYCVKSILYTFETGLHIWNILSWNIFW